MIKTPTSPGLAWHKKIRTFHTGEEVEALEHTFLSIVYDDGLPVVVDAWPIWDGSAWHIGDMRGALNHHLGPQGSFGVALGLWDVETLFGVTLTGDLCVSRLLPVEHGQAPAKELLDEAAYVICAVSALLQRTRYQPFALRIS